jgi:hypothetical protein
VPEGFVYPEGRKPDRTAVLYVVLLAVRLLRLSEELASFHELDRNITASPSTDDDLRVYPGAVGLAVPEGFPVEFAGTAVGSTVALVPVL